MPVSRRHIMALATTFVLSALVARRAVSQTVAYEYDTLGRIVKVTFSDGGEATYAYDEAGNRTQTGRVAGITGTFSATPTSIVHGNSSTLSWTSSGATSAVIDNGVGAVAPISGGSIIVSPATSTTYTLTLTRTGGLITRQAIVTVT